MRVRKRIVAALLCVLLSLGGTPVLAQPQVGFDGGAVYKLGADGPLAGAGALLPGDSVTANYLLRNDAAFPITFYLGIAGSGEGQFATPELHAQSLALLEALDLEVVTRGVDSQGNIGGITGTVYRGPASGSGLDQPGGLVSLGTFGANGWAVMQVTLTLPTHLGNQFQGTLAALDWTFLCSFDDGGSESSGGGGTGGGGGGGQYGGGGTGTGIGYTVIEDGEIPLGTVELVDEEVPLGSLPKTGGLSARDRTLVWCGAFLLLGAGTGIILARSKKGRRAR